MIPHATKSGKRHRKFFCTIDVPSIQRHIRIVQQGPLRVQAQVFVRAKAGVLSPKQCSPYSEADMWVGADYKTQ